MNAPAVEVVDLVKRYPRNPRPAVDGLSFAVEPGEVFGLLGPNGAGKTSTVGVLTTRVRASGGRARVSGVDVAAEPVAARRMLGVVPQRPNLDRSLSAKQNLLFHAAYHGVGRAERNRTAEELLERMGLADKASASVDTLSGGQSQRLLIARGLMHRPQVLFLDEPSTGLDPQARLFVHDRILELAGQGVTVVLTTHDMDEAAKLADRVGIVDRGKLLALDSPAALTRGLPGSTTLDLTVALDGTGPQPLVAALSDVAGVHRVERIAGGGHARSVGVGPWAFGGGPPGAPAGESIARSVPETGGSVPEETVRLRVYADVEPVVALPTVLRVLGERGGTVAELAIGEPSLEDVFIHLTGRELR